MVGFDKISGSGTTCSSLDWYRARESREETWLVKRWECVGRIVSREVGSGASAIPRRLRRCSKHLDETEASQEED